MTITEFLEARIAEDEREAEKGGDHNGRGVFARDNYGSLLIQPARVLAECAAKRAIIALYLEAERDGANVAMEYLPDALYAFAAIYKDHPDYRQEWAL